MRASVYNTESFPSAPRTEEGRLIVAASNTAIHAAVQESAANLFPGPITQPDVPRLLSATFAAGWQGGDITIVGTDANGWYQREVIADNPGATVAGTKVFATVTSISKELIAGTTDTVTIGTSGVANYYSTPWDSIGAAGAGIEIQTTGTLTGSWTLWRANRYNPNRNDDADWVRDAAFESAADFVNPSGAATHWATEQNGGQSFQWRLKYVPGGVGGSIFAWVTSEAV